LEIFNNSPKKGGRAKMQNKIVLAVLLSAIFLLAGCTQQAQASPGNYTPSVPSATPPASTGNNNPASTSPPVATPGAKLITLQELSQHNSISDCWMAIHGKVYNVTDYLFMHPGGESILQGCGTDATTLFETRPMGSGTPHSNRANRMLNMYYVGDLPA